MQSKHGHLKRIEGYAHSSSIPMPDIAMIPARTLGLTYDRPLVLGSEDSLWLRGAPAAWEFAAATGLPAAAAFAICLAICGGPTPVCAY